VPPAIGRHRADGPDATVVDIGGTTADSLARYLLGLGVPVEVLSPDDVREALRRRARELLEANQR
jgi:predicted DNA-binding transcriptional regulator YafY